LKKILILFSLCLVPLLLNPAFAYSHNSLSGTHLIGESATIFLDIKFGEDTIKQLLTRSIVVNHIDDITLIFYGDEISLSDPKLRVVGDGSHFRISSIPDGIIMYGHKNMDLENYKINIYIATNQGLTKFTVSTAFKLPDDKVLESEPIKEKAPYIPDLIMSSSHDFRTYWKDTFNIDIQAYDARINPSATGFEGRIDGVDVKVLLSLDNVPFATLSGVTANNGEWNGEYFIKENISAPGEYVVDVIVSYLGETVSKSSTMFVIAATTGGGTSNHSPIANAGPDQLTASSPVDLDGSGSSDPDGDTITYSWVKISGIDGTISDSTLESPTFTTGNTGEVVFELTVSDGRKSSTDSVTITVI